MSAKRFGGEFSPGASGAKMPPKAETPPQPAGGFFAAAMFFAPVPLLFSIYGEILRGAPMDAAVEIVGGIMLLLSAELLREGRKAEVAYNARASAARPLPRKILAAIICALATGLIGARAGDQGVVAGLLFGVLAGGVHVFAFGLDPLRNKGYASDAKRADAALAAAEEVIADTLAAARRLGDEGLSSRVEELVAAARPVLRQIEEDPRDLPRARRFLSVTLEGARDATVKYARLGVEDPEMRTAYVALLTQLERSFAQSADRLAAEDRVELEVEIEVLSDRLRRDGIEAGH